MCYTLPRPSQYLASAVVILPNCHIPFRTVQLPPPLQGFHIFTDPDTWLEEPGSPTHSRYVRKVLEEARYACMTCTLAPFFGMCVCVGGGGVIRSCGYPFTRGFAVLLPTEQHTCTHMHTHAHT
jgi:hypothetical protein